MEILSIITGIVIGALVAFIILKLQGNSTSGDKHRLEERNSIAEKKNLELTEELRSERQKLIELTASFSSLQSDFKNLLNKKDELEQLQKKFESEFKNLATEILE